MHDLHAKHAAKTFPLCLPQLPEALASFFKMVDFELFLVETQSSQMFQ
jgi:hypothetical protein